MSLRVTFVLPGLVSIPSGGFKVIYELANGLAKKGHVVHIVHLQRPDIDNPSIRFPPSIVGPRTRLLHAHVPWFQFLRTIKLEMSRPVAIDFPDADVIVGTGWQTANVIHNLPPEKGRKFFFVQDYEHWVLAEGNRRKDIREAFALPMMRISSSPAVSQMLENMELTFECELCPRLDLDCQFCPSS